MKLSCTWLTFNLALLASRNGAEARRLGQHGPGMEDLISYESTGGTSVSVPRQDPAASSSSPVKGGVYVNMNQIDNNQVAAFRRSGLDGDELEHVGNYDTGGEGFPYKNDILLPDNALGTQGALSVSGDYVFVVNAGSNSFSQFKINTTDMSLSLMGVTPTPQKFPCTLDARVDLNTVCVAMCAGEGAIACYEISDEGGPLAEVTKVGEGSVLTEIHRVPSLGIPIGQVPVGNPEDPANETRPGINVLVNVKQILFTPRGDALFVAIFDQGIWVFPTEQDESSTGVALGTPVLHSIDSGDLSFQHRPFSFAFQEKSSGSLLLHVQDPFATTAGELFFPPNIGVALSAGGTLSTYRVEGSGANTSFVVISPQIGAGQKGSCWCAYNNGTVITTNTAGGTITVFREMEILGEGIYDVAAAALKGTEKDLGVVGFNGGPFANSGGSPISAMPVDVAFSHDGAYFYVLNEAAVGIDIYSVDPTENTVTNSEDRAKHVGFIAIPGVPHPTSDKTLAGDDEEWKRQIDYWQAWSGALGMQGMDTYPRPRA
ncbi:Pfam:Muc_lac_enz [Seminavis robusta]|uniref:Pfam:Muc_lac_enz n=1 Tax=Seminavis robusta TaxID=568900 RepID=A0A9N8DYG3_9STRA|nr:Pfam:Muc_lac_enz [Seminavis robusta]|eukprot:Sro342_g121840.1 Pfam:Muc_lac_enz (544) ;mRNA; f:70237-71868